MGEKRKLLCVFMCFHSSCRNPLASGSERSRGETAISEKLQPRKLGEGGREAGDCVNNKVEEEMITMWDIGRMMWGSYVKVKAGLMMYR